MGAPRCGSGPNWCLERPPIPHCNWRTIPSSQSPSLPALSLPLPPTPLGSFCNAPGVRDGAAQSGVGGGVLGGVEGESPLAVLGARPTSRGTRKRAGRQRRLARGDPSYARDSGIFLRPFSYSSLRRRWTQFWAIILLRLGPCQSPNPLLPTPFRNL